MFHSILVLFHVCNAVVGLLSGFLSTLFQKGSGLHRVAGNIFFVSMLGMAGSGAYMAAFMKPNGGNVMGGALTIYLVSTGWVAARRREREVSIFDLSALLVSLAIAAAGVTWGFQAARSHTGLRYGYPPGLYFVFASIALLFAASDIRMILHGGVFGAQRIARHLWRLCFALLFATFSLFPGQGKLFSSALRQNNLLYAPHIFLIGTMIFWMVRVRVRKRVPQDNVTAVRQGDEAIVRKVA
jgi:uncharacterized membrane protein